MVEKLKKRRIGRKIPLSSSKLILSLSWKSNDRGGLKFWTCLHATVLLAVKYSAELNKYILLVRVICIKLPTVHLNVRTLNHHLSFIKTLIKGCIRYSKVDFFYLNFLFYLKTRMNQKQWIWILVFNATFSNIMATFRTSDHLDYLIFNWDLKSIYENRKNLFKEVTSV
jgi:hypothetical protein